ncbi:MAG: hypothetical protein DRJ37_02830 [Thermoprotei archaeon]|nr:MAG: hypothetical protein DRJ37_02830 [Thermoprotei archaeon]
MNEEFKAIGEKIRSRLESTRFRDHVEGKAWEYTWMEGFRIEVSVLLNLKLGDRVLDIGCGDGWYSIQNALAYPYVRFVGVDLYEADEAREIAGLVGAWNCEFYKMDVLEMNFEEEFDHVVSFMALGNICETPSDIEKLFKNCWKALKNKGKLLIVEAFEEDFPEEVRAKLKSLYEFYRRLGKSVGEDKETILNKRVTLDILETVGFTILKHIKWEFSWHMDREEVKEYFDFKELPIEIPEKFWVFDKPKQVAVILAEKQA